MKSQRQDTRWHAQRRAQRVVRDRDGIAVVSLGVANVWDFGDLVRLREVANVLIREGRQRIGIDLAHVGYLPSGFMNMLCEWQERGLDVYLFDARPNVRDMLWYRWFTEPVSEGAVRIVCSSEAMREAFLFNEESGFDSGSGDEIPAWCDAGF